MLSIRYWLLEQTRTCSHCRRLLQTDALIAFFRLADPVRFSRQRDVAQLRIHVFPQNHLDGAAKPGKKLPFAS
jgi:hypothetical protein